MYLSNKFPCLGALIILATATAFQTSLQRTVPVTRTLNHRHQIRTPKAFQSKRTALINTDGVHTNMQLQALPAALVAASAPVGSVSVLAFVIIVHEMGHFLAARSQGIKVKEFSVGIGPRITGFTTKADPEDEEDEGIEFNLRAIPLGGYVRFPENYNATLGFELQVEADKKRSQIEMIVQENREKESSATPSAGLLSSIGFSLAKDKTTEAERIKALETLAIQLTQEDNNSAPWWNSIFGNNKLPKEQENQNSITIEMDGTVTVPPIDYYNDPDLLQNRPWAQRALVLVGGVVFNIILAFSLYFGELTIGNGLPKPVFGQGVVINSVARANSAGVGILGKGDVILSVNGEPFPSVYVSEWNLLSC
jgi:membrane-associated protease RseP (regulator of RpoE activity)